MKINRNNYENIFLLYVDDELSAQEKMEVEKFISENNDLRNEFELLIQTKIPIEKIPFHLKQSLLRTESLQINSINFEEKILLYIDDELSESEKLQTESFIKNNSAFQKIYETFKLTKLPIERISFVNKSLLYKTDNKAPVFILKYWKQFTAAAAFIGFIILTAIYFTINTHNQYSIAKQSVHKISEQKQKIDQRTLAFNPEKKIALPVHQQNLEENFKRKINQSNTGLIEQYNSPSQTDTITFKNFKEEEPIVLNVSKKSNSNLKKIEIGPELHNTILISSENNQNDIAINTVKTAVYKELETDDENKTVYIGTMEINKDKFRGIIRKASSLFKNKIKNEESQNEFTNSHSLE